MRVERGKRNMRGEEREIGEERERKTRRERGKRGGGWAINTRMTQRPNVSADTERSFSLANLITFSVPELFPVDSDDLAKSLWIEGKRSRCGFLDFRATYGHH